MFALALWWKAAEIRLSKYAAKAADSRYPVGISVAADTDAAYPRSKGIGVKLGACSVIWLTSPVKVC